MKERSAREKPGRIVVSVFCGGRGGSSLIREFLRQPGVELNALINAYDDGLSTGELRDFIPGMLGPSDFRKNLANFLHWHSSHQYALTRLLEFRLEGEAEGDIARLEKWVAQTGAADDTMLSPEIRSLVGDLDRMRSAVREYLAVFFEYRKAHAEPFEFADCSLGNLIFAGAYLKSGRNFNAAASELARVFQSQARLLNVTQGANRVLVALKEDGEILECEAEIAGGQSPGRIIDFFLLEAPLSIEQWTALRALGGPVERASALQKLHRPDTISPEARDAIFGSDIIVYGPGTQFSSLMPSYKTFGLSEAMAASRARTKLFVMNIHRDHDIQSVAATELVEQALEVLHDPRNERGSITHVLYANASAAPDQLMPRGDVESLESRVIGLKWIEGDFENPIRAGAHSGYLTVRQILNVFEEAQTATEPELDIYINLYQRSLAASHLIQEFLELPWRSYFKRVRLRFNNIELPAMDLPAHLTIEAVRRDEMFSEVEELSEWAASRKSKYLVTISGDGQYRLCDILHGMDILTQHSFAAVYGSRTQSRNQFYNSLDAAYGESPLLYAFSLAGGFLFSFLFVLRFGVIFSDPLTGLRLYNRSSLAGVLGKLSRLDDHSASGITKILMQGGCEIAEIPITYRTFQGFTNTKWRLLRSFRNAWRIFF